MHYLDNAATTRVLPAAAEAAARAMTEGFGNPSSIYKLGTEAKDLLEASREVFAETVGCNKRELIFNSCATEGTNTVFCGALRRYGRQKRHVVTTAIEHSSVSKTLNRLLPDGLEFTAVPPDESGSVDPEKLLGAIREDTFLVSVMSVNSESGAVLPVEKIAAGLSKMKDRPLFHTDAVQALFKIPLNLHNLGVDFATFSGHKIGAPKGIGVLYLRNGVKLPPLLTGGGQEEGMRSGTESVPLIAALGEAVRIRRENFERDLAHLRELNEYLRRRIPEIPGITIISPASAVPHIFNFSMNGGRSEVIMRILAEREVYVSNGSACSKGKRSEVLSAMGVPSKVIDGAVRVSLCPENTKDDIDELLLGLNDARTFF